MHIIARESEGDNWLLEIKGERFIYIKKSGSNVCCTRYGLNSDAVFLMWLPLTSLCWERIDLLRGQVQEELVSSKGPRS